MSLSQEVVNLLIGVAMSIFGWFAREMWQAVKELKTDLSSLREELPRRYVDRDTMEHALDRIDHKLEKIVEKLDSKADK